jgi:hypothetical protein
VDILTMTNVLHAEIAANTWWDGMSLRERKAYVSAHPHSKYAKAAKVLSQARVGLVDHMTQQGWQRKRGAWYHPRSRRYVVLKTNGGARHHMVITHANGDVGERRTDSDRVAKRIIRTLSKPASGNISGFLGANKGSLHAALGVPHGQKIPLGKLEKLARNEDHPLSGRARLVLNLQRKRKAGADDWLPANRS